MALPDVKTVVADPEFHALPYEERRKVMKTIDADFAGLPALEQEKALNGLAKMFAGGGLKPAAPELTKAHGTELAAAHGNEPRWTDQLAGVREAILGPNSNVTVKGIAPYYRTGLEGAGAVAGTVLGAPFGPVAGAGMGGAGFATGKAIADRIDEAAGIKHQRTDVDNYIDPIGGQMKQGSAAEVVTRPIRDTLTATAMAGPAEAAAGLVSAAGRGVGKVADWAGRVGGRSANVDKAAGEVIASWTSQSPVYPKNAEEARAVEALINAGAKEGEPLFRFSLAEQTFDPKQVKLQRSRQLGKDVAELKAQQEMDNAAALSRYFRENFGGKEGAGDVLSAASRQRAGVMTQEETAQRAADQAARSTPTTSPQAAGVGITEDIRAAKGPVKSTLDELQAAIPDYPMRLDNLIEKIRVIALDPKISADERSAVEAFAARLQALIPKSGPTTHNAMGIGRTLDDMADKAFRSGDNATGRALSILKKEGLQKDLDAVSEAARTGKIADYRGQSVNVDALSERLETTLEALAKAKSKGAEPDIKAAVAELKARGVPTMQVTREDDRAYAERMVKDYERIFGKPAPTAASTTKEAEALQAEADRLRGILSEVSPGQDVAAAMRAYNRYAREEWYGRFKKGAVDDVTRTGNESTGGRIQIEDIPNRFKDPSGADDLIRAVGPEQARERMRGSFAYDLIQNATDPTTGQIVSRKLDTWISRNKAVLSKYGLQDEFNGLQKAQAVADSAKQSAREFEASALGKLAGKDPGKLVQGIIEGSRTAAQMAEVMQQLVGDKAAIKGLKNAFGEYVNAAAETTWQQKGGGAAISQAQFTRTMQKVREASRVLFRDEPDKYKALETIQRAYEIGSRTSRSPVSTGSDTAEKGMDTLAQGALKAAGGWKFSILTKVVDKLKSIGTSNVDAVVNQALFDPELAYRLLRGARGQVAPDVFKAQIESHPLYPFGGSRKVVDMREWQRRQDPEMSRSDAGVLNRKLSRAAGYEQSDRE